MHLLRPRSLPFFSPHLLSFLVHWTTIRTVSNLHPWFIFKIVPVAGKTVMVSLMCLRAHIATCAVLCKAVGLCSKFTTTYEKSLTHNIPGASAPGIIPMDLNSVDSYLHECVQLCRNMEVANCNQTLWFSNCPGFHSTTVIVKYSLEWGGACLNKKMVC